MEDRGTPRRKPRADAARNREKLIEAARAVFATGGPEASLETVARTAGVGIATLYRHFPTREALFEAVYRHEVDQLVGLAEALAAEAEPVEALRRWLRASVGMVATKKGMIAALALTIDGSAAIYADSRARLTACVERLMRRAVATGRLEDRLSPEDVLHALVGLCSLNDRPDWQATAVRLIDVFVDGLRPPRPTEER